MVAHPRGPSFVRFWEDAWREPLQPQPYSWPCAEERGANPETGAAFAALCGGTRRQPRNRSCIRGPVRRNGQLFKEICPIQAKISRLWSYLLQPEDVALYR